MSITNAHRMGKNSGENTKLYGWGCCRNVKLLPKQLQDLPLQPRNQVSQTKHPGSPKVIFPCGVWLQGTKAGCDWRARNFGGLPLSANNCRGSEVYRGFTEDINQTEEELLAIGHIRERKQRKSVAEYCTLFFSGPPGRGLLGCKQEISSNALMWKISRSRHTHNKTANSRPQSELYGKCCG